MKQKLIELVGWYGTVAIVLAYALNSFGVFTPENTGYQLLNLTGAGGIIVISLNKKAHQPAVLNLIWAIIALISLTQIFL